MSIQLKSISLLVVGADAFSREPLPRDFLAVHFPEVRSEKTNRDLPDRPYPAFKVPGFLSLISTSADLEALPSSLLALLQDGRHGMPAGRVASDSQRLSIFVRSSVYMTTICSGWLGGHRRTDYD
ncbi:hypothetical protein RhiXN_09145 [Rhizoctonia solani]|uniref:Uncharacterized protein n=1 Tax=Rhizoctonia solani TaxID=456999 RepID=A0A8H8NVB1_9AGAM|nr:uncharacterized protein RhiXN_09145 [Rhizoctonia solani]QRW20170.1 hypothetical protein RhiXN_09145 [Rhizoctonia solani]